MTKVAFVRWKDAVADEATEPLTLAGAELVELEEVGFLLDENDDAIQIGMETHYDEGVMPGRWRLTIPKTSIIELRVREFKKCFPPQSRRSCWMVEDLAS
jgi:hypothetical protein